MSLNDKIREYIDVPIRLYLDWISGEGKTYMLVGKIKEYCPHEISGGYLTFEHSVLERQRLQTPLYIVNLGRRVIAGIDILSENYDESIYLECKHCGKLTEMSRAKNSEAEDDAE